MSDPPQLSPGKLCSIQKFKSPCRQYCKLHFSSMYIGMTVRNILFKQFYILLKNNIIFVTNITLAVWILNSKVITVENWLGRKVLLLLNSHKMKCSYIEPYKIHDHIRIYVLGDCIRAFLSPSPPSSLLLTIDKSNRAALLTLSLSLSVLLSLEWAIINIISSIGAQFHLFFLLLLAARLRYIQWLDETGPQSVGKYTTAWNCATEHSAPFSGHPLLCPWQTVTVVKNVPYSPTFCLSSPQMLRVVYMYIQLHKDSTKCKNRS